MGEDRERVGRPAALPGHVVPVDPQEPDLGEVVEQPAGFVRRLVAAPAGEFRAVQLDPLRISRADPVGQQHLRGGQDLVRGRADGPPVATTRRRQPHARGDPERHRRIDRGVTGHRDEPVIRPAGGINAQVDRHRRPVAGVAGVAGVVGLAGHG
ncbi:hypothetical protein Ae331Ps2_6347c [Pseudonocardia sp. Ae331_Ps2]|nr:hypothetical protein Ae331Ps2_6347c [Pseudonocardia sp. Ae331_Ps2]